MTRIAVLGAGGAIARHAVQMLGEREDIQQTLFVRDADRLREVPANARVVEGDVLDAAALGGAIEGQDIVYANLAGPVDDQARAIVAAMTAAGVSRLIFVTSLGIYDEVPGAFGEWNRSMIGGALVRYRAAADVIEATDLDWTILRPAWLTDADEVDYEVTGRDEPFRGTEVSRRSVAALVVALVTDPARGVRESLGVDKPGSDGDRPSFM